MLDNDLILTILSIGDRNVGHLKLQKMVFLLLKASQLKSNATAYKFGAFDEYLMEKLQMKGQDLITRKGAKYLLTDKGKTIYLVVRDKVSKKKPKIVEFSDIIQKMNEDELLGVTYFLYPEYAIESEITEKVGHTIELLKNRKSKFQVSESDGEVSVGIME